MMPIEYKTSFFDQLVAVCTEIKNTLATDNSELSVADSNKVEDLLNKIFDESNCTSVIFTNNTDKLLFGINVNLTISDSDLLKILLTDEEVKFERYQLEIDTNIFNKLEAMEVAAYIVEEVYSYFDPARITDLRSIVDDILYLEKESINIKQSVNYTQILTFGIKDTLRKIASMLYRPADCVGYNIYAETFETHGILEDVAGKLKSFIFDDDDATTPPKLGVIQWSFMVYKDISLYYRMAEETLMDASKLTGSVLEQREIEKTLKCLRRALNEVVNEAAINEAVVAEFSLFKRLKQKGLQSLNDDLYELRIRAKNCEDTDEAMYIVRQINTRMGILEDYITSNDISEAESNRWNGLLTDYANLRNDLGKKKLGNKASYGVFVNYDYLDTLDK